MIDLCVSPYDLIHHINIGLFLLISVCNFCRNLNNIDVKGLLPLNIGQLTDMQLL
jgi:hypothetical protein